MAQESIIISLLDELKTGIKNIKTPQIDYAKIDNLMEKLEQATDKASACIDEVGKLTEQIQRPLTTEHRHTFDIRSSWALITMAALFIISASAIGVLIAERAESEHLRDNDLKYRYIKMKGCVPAQGIIDLENLFEINRDNAKIKQLNKDVEEYERAVQERAALEEQAWLRQQEAEKIKKKDR